MTEIGVIFYQILFILLNIHNYRYRNSIIFFYISVTPSVEVITDPSIPLKAIDKSDAIMMCNVTFGNPSNLQKVSDISNLAIILLKLLKFR